MLDKASVKPGPMGWGVKDESLQQKVRIEKDSFEKIAKNTPQLVCRRAAKEVKNNGLFDRIKEMQKADGFTGFSFLYLEKAIFGEFLPWLAQLIGSCVASGGIRCDARRMLADVCLFGDLEILFGDKIVGPQNLSPFGPFTYRGGRRRAGINVGDGSYCTVNIESKMEDGVLPCFAVDLNKYTDAYPEPQNTSTYRKWGSRTGDSYMAIFKDIASQYKLLESEDVKDAAQSKELLTEHLKPHQICSNWAFKPDRKHPTWKLANGDPVWIYKRNTRDSWAHNMTVNGWRDCIADGKGYVEIDNSWGPKAHNMGSFFLIEDDEYQQWLRSAEVRSVGDFQLPEANLVVW